MDSYPSSSSIVTAKGVHLDASPEMRELFVPLIEKAAGLASGLTTGLPLELGISTQRSQIRLAASTAISTVNSLLTAVVARCNQGHPPEDIEMKVNSAGNLVYRCFHSPAHEWDLQGRRLP